MGFPDESGASSQILSEPVSVFFACFPFQLVSEEPFHDAIPGVAETQLTIGRLGTDIVCFDVQPKSDDIDGISC